VGRQHQERPTSWAYHHQD